MKRKNLLTNILNIFMQIAIIIWFFMYTKRILFDGIYFNDEIELLLEIFSGKLIIGFSLIAIIAIAIKNLRVGIQNRKNSKAIFVLYIINSIMFLLQPIALIFVANVEESYATILMICNYLIIIILTIILFILNRKINENTKNIKQDIIISIVIVILTIFAIIAPKIQTSVIRSKFEKEAIDINTISLDDYWKSYIIAISSEDGKYDFINSNGEVEFSIDADDVSYPAYIYTNSGVIKYVLADKDNKRKVMNINNLDDIKTIFEYEKGTTPAFVNIFNQNAEMKKKYEDYVEKAETNYRAEDIEYSDLTLVTGNYNYSRFEENADYKYTYYKNSNILIQVEEKNQDNWMQENGLKNEKQYYLIKNGEKIKLDCEQLIFSNGDDDEQYIYVYDNKYIPFIGKNSNGYFNENGEKFEVPTSYVFLYKNDDIGIVAKVNEKDKGIDISDISGKEAIQAIIVDNNLKKISDAYNSATASNEFVILYNYDYNSKDYDIDNYTDISIYNKKGNEITNDVEFFGIVDEKLLICKSSKDDTISFYNKTGKINAKQYKWENKIMGQLSNFGGESLNYRYFNIVSEIK